MDIIFIRNLNGPFELTHLNPYCAKEP